MAEPDGGGRFRYEVVARSDAPVDEVWSLVSEAARWKEWSFLTRSFLLREGTPAPDGVGALRRFGVGRFGSVEEVVAFEPPRHLGYVARKGLPVRRYRADVVLEAEGTGTRVTWTGSLEPLVPGTGPLVLAYARSFVRRFTRGLVAHTRARAAGPASG